MDPEETEGTEGTEGINPVAGSDSEAAGAGSVAVEERAAVHARVEQAARVAHEANRAYCATIGDDSQVPWLEAPEWQRDSARRGVAGVFNGSIATPQESHESWTREKMETGWVYGPVKDAEAKTHPCLVPYRDLPQEQRQKDAIFFAVVRSFT